MPRFNGCRIIFCLFEPRSIGICRSGSSVTSSANTYGGHLTRTQWLDTLAANAVGRLRARCPLQRLVWHVAIVVAAVVVVGVSISEWHRRTAVGTAIEKIESQDIEVVSSWRGPGPVNKIAI